MEQMRRQLTVPAGMCAVAVFTMVVSADQPSRRGPSENRPSDLATQPVIGARSRAVLTVDGKQFRDANGNGMVDRYEDWRLAVGVRVDNLVSRMTVDEKAGLMLIDTMGPG